MLFDALETETKTSRPATSSNRSSLGDWTQRPPPSARGAKAAGERGGGGASLVFFLEKNTGPPGPTPSDFFESILKFLFKEEVLFCIIIIRLIKSYKASNFLQKTGFLEIRRRRT